MINLKEKFEERSAIRQYIFEWLQIAFLAIIAFLLLFFF